MMRTNEGVLLLGPSCSSWRIDGAIQVRSNVDPTFYSLVGSGRSGGDHQSSSLLENPYALLFIDMSIPP
ncbi:hypothetical protein N665_1963s0002 [Sinapis alba]|nr:hypothetical protein N665_1963s0002 [Sinapis alba]